MKLSIVVTALGLVSIPAIASAHGGNNDPNVVHACIGNVSKVVRIVGVSGSCLSSPPLVAETAAHWDMQGPSGINGVDGTSVSFVNYFAGSQNGCPNGGAIYAAGNPAVNAYVCNGVDGQDGQDGTATRADGPCFDNTNRYVDCGNGTVTDTVTGLIWLKQANCVPANSWTAANQAAAGLKHGDCGGSLTDKSSPGDWRLPTQGEWLATIARAVALGCKLGGPRTPPSLTNDAATFCYGDGSTSSFVGVTSVPFWSSTASESNATFAQFANLDDGSVADRADKVFALGVWPVRSASR